MSDIVGMKVEKFAALIKNPPPHIKLLADQYRQTNAKAVQASQRLFQKQKECKELEGEILQLQGGCEALSNAIVLADQSHEEKLD